MTRFSVLEVRVGRARPFGPRGRRSAIDKGVVDHPVQVSATGLEGDEVGDPKHHGGPDKAVHVYPHEHYAVWRQELPVAVERLRAGGFGENLVVEGVTEAQVCLGDRWQVDEALLELSQGRQPCWKLNVRFGVPDMARRVQETGRTGWYFRVLEPGRLAGGAVGRLVARPHPEWPLTRVAQVLYRDVLDRPALEALEALPTMPASWRRLAQRRLARGRVEDWTRRLEVPS